MTAVQALLAAPNTQTVCLWGLTAEQQEQLLQGRPASGKGPLHVSEGGDASCKLTFQPQG